MAPPPSSNGTTTSVQVALRIRPPTNQDSTSIPARFQRTVINATSSTSVAVEASTSTPSSVGASAAAVASTSSASAGKKQVFTFDQVHGPATAQHALYISTAQPLISRFVEGFNCTILAYGQTSSGKTFTMTGIDLDADPADPSNSMGIIPRAVSNIFSRCREIKEERGTAWNYNLRGSFIEIYNEDLIDLLTVDDAGAKTMVQIREDKQGHIIWEGLREINVKNANEVMSLIRQGTSIRRTNETEMNAQSSRSHAIFSLTLTQKKFTGSGSPPRSSSPLQPGGRSPSRLARPSSSIYGGANGARVSSPTFGRPGTPSFASAIGRGGRPASSIGMLTADGGRRQSLIPGAAQPNGDTEPGEWVTVVSKFHFVDLAGSERLKRTAAAGDRIKEGISINSGLLALGNVISALGDPARAKSHTASYVPYRDSKLTRLLQDSLGGNAHTLMIACVSPAEWNANETINTLKYANRARNIKNRAVVNEKEDGWDDVEWLQAQVTRLRKDLKSIKEGGTVLSTIGETEVSEGSVKKAHAQMAELRHNYEDLREKYVERTEELTRLRRELAEKQRASGGAVGGTAKYEEIVGPVIEEYEKTISAMEAELSLNRAALRHTNDLVDEKEAELSQLSERHATTEMYVAELRARVAKLSEREASTEAYIRDLEEKVKLFNEDNLSSSGSITDLKRELAKFRDTESHSTDYILDLESRLAKSDESVLVLQQSVEQLEAECDAHNAEFKALQLRLENLQRDGQSWKSDLEERERKIERLETDLREREATLREAAESRERLGLIANDVSEARRNLEVVSTKSEVSSINEPENPLESQLVALQQTHTATLADLSSVSAKYRDALREIADLAAQLQEAKVNASIPPTPLSESPERPAEIPSPRRRMARGSSRDGLDIQTNGTGKRLLFRQAGSTESLHGRSQSQSLSLSQELSSARSRKTSFSSHGTSNSLSLSPTSRPTLSLHVNPNERSVQSLEQEIMRLQEVLKERESEIAGLEQSLKENSSRPTISAEMPSSFTPSENGEGSPDMHLSPKTMNQFQELRHSLDEVVSPSDADESLDRLNELMRAMAQKESSHREIVDGLNAELRQVRRQHDELTVLSRDQAINMSNEIEGSRARHEEDLATLEEFRRREADLSEALQRVEADHVKDVERLKAEHEEALLSKQAEIDDLLKRTKGEHDAAFQTLCDQLASASSALENAKREHEEAFGKLKADHAEEISRRSEEIEKFIERTRSEHDAHLQDVLQKHSTELSDAISKQQAEHEEQLRVRTADHATTLEQTRKDYDDAIAKLISDHQESVLRKEQEASATLQRTEEEYYDGLTKLRQDHAYALEKQTSEAATSIERLKDEHARALHMAEIAREGSLSENHPAQEQALKELLEAHSAAIAHKENLFAADIQKLKDEHTQAAQAKEEQHRSNVQRLKADHATTLHDKELVYADKLDQLQSEHTRLVAAKDLAHQAELAKLGEEHAATLEKLQQSEAEVVRLGAELEGSRAEHSATKASLQKELEQLLQAKEEHQVALEVMKRATGEEHSKLHTDHESALTDVKTQAAEERASLVTSHAEEVARLKAEHEAAMAVLEADFVAAQEQHQRDLDKSHDQTERIIAEEKSRLTASLSDVQRKQVEEITALRKDYEALAHEKTELASTLTELEARHAEELATVQEEREALLSDCARLTRTIAEAETNHAAEYAMLQQDHDLVVEELEAHKAAAAELATSGEEIKERYEAILREKTGIVNALQEDLLAVQVERDTYSARVATLSAELDVTHSQTSELVSEASKRQSLVEELEKHRSVLAEMQENLQKTKDEMDNLQSEKNKQEVVLRELQSQINRSPSPGASRIVGSSRPNGIPAAKQPPLAPLPSLPSGSPTVRTMHEAHSSTASSVPVSPTSPRSMDFADATSTPGTSVVGGHAPDAQFVTQVQKQAKQLEEQEVMIKTLNKQLSHCESDLQAHMDMVATLETSLADAEKNLRKARMQATEIARERDNLNGQMSTLRQELHEAKAEVVNVRRSVVEEKQSLENRLDEERRAKERARQQLDSRMDELQRRKSKFACL